MTATVVADETVVVRRGPLLLTGAAAGVGGALVPAVAVPGLWRLWQLYAMVFGAVAFLELAAIFILLGWPTRRTARNGALAAALSLLLWLATRVFGFMTRLDPWQPADTVAGFTDHAAAVLQVVAFLALLTVTVRGDRPPHPVRHAFAWLVLLPVLTLVVAAGAAGVLAALPGARGIPLAGTGPVRTLEYCRPAGVPLAMDFSAPPGARGAPVVLYLHGGGFVLGDRTSDGFGARLAGSDHALFAPLRSALTARGFAVAAIDYRLAPATPWPAPLADAKCAVRFLKSHAADLGVDPGRVAAWGFGAGGTLAALLGTTGADAGLDAGEYAGVPGTVRAVVDLGGPADLTDTGGFDPLTQALLRLGLDTAARRAASPDSHVAPGAPPFLIVQGEDAVAKQAAAFAGHLRAAGVDVTYLAVRGTGHAFDTPAQQPSPGELVTSVTAFLARTSG